MNLTDVNTKVFSGGECHVELGDGYLPPSDVLTAHIRNSDDLMKLVLATDVLKYRGVQPNTLELPYMPYARQDRRTTPGSPDSLRIVSKMINDLGYKKVRVYEPHSGQTTSFLDNCEVVPFNKAALQFVMDALQFHKTNGDPRVAVFLSPDKGAVGRVSDLQEITGFDMALALKKRNPQTGWVEVKRIFGDLDGKDVFVMDDIGDGCATFNQLADFILEDERRRGVPNDKQCRLHLFVAHGIFSKGTDEVLKRYDTIGTTDSFYIEEKMPPGTPRKVWVYPAF